MGWRFEVGVSGGGVLEDGRLEAVENEDHRWRCGLQPTSWEARCEQHKGSWLGSSFEGASYPPRATKGEHRSASYTDHKARCHRTTGLWRMGSNRKPYEHVSCPQPLI